MDVNFYIESDDTKTYLIYVNEDESVIYTVEIEFATDRNSQDELIMIDNIIVKITINKGRDPMINGFHTEIPISYITKKILVDTDRDPGIDLDYKYYSVISRAEPYLNFNLTPNDTIAREITELFEQMGVTIDEGINDLN